MRTEAVAVLSRMSSRRFASSRRNRLVIAVAAALLTAGVGWRVVMARVDERGWAFFDTGKTISDRLEALAVTVVARDAAAVRAWYSPSFRGERIGLNTYSPGSLRDGVSQARFDPDRTPVDIDGAAVEWSAISRRS